MNNKDPFDEIFSPLREITPPQSVQQQNRAAIHTSLGQPARKEWWRRTIALPLPLALSAAALLLISLGANALDAIWRDKLPGPNIATQPERSHAAEPSASLALAGPHVQYSETQRYLSGIGVVDRNIVCEIQE